MEDNTLRGTRYMMTEETLEKKTTEIISINDDFDDDLDDLGYISTSAMIKKSEETVDECIRVQEFGTEMTKEVVNKNEDIVTEQSLRVAMFNALADYLPINIYCDRNVAKEYNHYKADLIIEKVGDNIITVERMGFKPFYVKSDKEKLVTRNMSLEEYIEWLKQDTIKRYNNSITEEEFNQLEKLIIVDGEIDKVKLNSNETYITRREALARIAQKYEVLIDLSMENCHIKFVDDENIYCAIDVEGLGYKISSSIGWVEEISKRLNVVKTKKIRFTGVAGEEKLLSELKKYFQVEGNHTFESLAWEI